MAKKNPQVRFEEVEKAMEKNNSRPSFIFKKRPFKFTKKQNDILKCMFDERSKVIIIEGPAGTSKSYLSIYAALSEFSKNNIESILYLRTAVESASRSLGFLKGDLDEKFSVYKQVLEDKVEELVEEKDQKFLMNSSLLEALPINYIRGASWRNKFVTLDEAQNANLDELKTLMTRIGEGSKLVICGDKQQSDIKHSGLKSLKMIFNDEECRDRGIHFFQLTEEDVVRSEIVKFVVQKFQGYETGR